MIENNPCYIRRPCPNPDCSTGLVPVLNEDNELRWTFCPTCKGNNIVSVRKEEKTVAGFTRLDQVINEQITKMMDNK